MLTQMSEEDWDVVLMVFRAVLPRRGDKGRDDRKFLEALHYFTVHNITWRALPAEFGDWNAVWKRFWRLSRSGVFDAMFEALAATSSTAHLVQMLDSTTARQVSLTRDGCVAGARLTLPLLPSIVVFAGAFGSLAAQKGMSWHETLTMSGIVFAGASQLVAIELWREVWSLPAVLEVMAVTAFINARLILMSAALQPWLRHASGPRQALMLFLLTDANWLLGMRYRQDGGQDLGVYLGSGALLWVVWVAATLPGYLAGALVPEPRRFGLDLLLPIFFCAMLVPLWRGVRPAVPWAVAGCVALAVQALAPGYAFIIAGALAGALTGAVLGNEARDEVREDPGR